jgi:hypothetical protein
LIKAFSSIKYKDTYNYDFEDSKTLFLKKTFAVMLGVVLTYPVYFATSYIKNSIIIRYQQEQISKANSILDELKQVKQNLYQEKGKTIILEDEIDFNKIAQYIQPIKNTCPKFITYDIDKQETLDITVLYDNTVLAYAVHLQLDKNHVQNTYYITPNTKVAKIKITIPIKKIIWNGDKV